MYKQTLIFAAVYFGVLHQVKGQETVNGCIDAGIEIGRQRTEQFCSLLEAKYQNRPISFSAERSSISAQFCSVAIARSCQATMKRALADHPLCASLLAHNWTDSADEFASTKELSCPEPEVVKCPFLGARIHKNFWCKPMLRHEYWAYADGVWWRFIRGGVVQGDESSYLVEASDGAQRIIERFELTIVSADYSSFVLPRIPVLRYMRPNLFMGILLCFFGAL